MSVYYNPSTVTKIKVSDFKPSTWFKYRRQIRIFGLLVRREGIHSYDGFWCGMSIEGHTLKDGVVYENPSVTLYFRDNARHKLHFPSIEAANSYAERVTHKTWIRSKE